MQSAAMKERKWKAVLPGADRAFTLIEVLVAMAIFSIGILAVGTLILSTAHNNTSGNVLTEATMLARAKIEEKKRAADAGALSAGTETETNIDRQGNPGGIYTRECDISNIPAVPNALEIKVTVSWNRQGMSRSVVLRTLN